MRTPEVPLLFNSPATGDRVNMMNNLQITQQETR
jgi:hypothetical protein